ncbi:hypothetical protein LIER_06865 [Lithospermum erythrorhizon]|uniref:Reverse transcriptase domain-containing protein n=1 Tax=Lithospermum erythrorhizon TaxID=34254 RepID=A0AAV3P5Y2_LITER
MCTDFTSINKACPKDCYPLPKNDRLVDSRAGYKIGWNMEIYVDDMLIKSSEASDHEANLRESFENLRRYNLWLNTEKCVFGVTFGKFLGYMINQRGIEPKPDKIAAVRAICPQT